MDFSNGSHSLYNFNLGEATLDRRMIHQFHTDLANLKIEYFLKQMLKSEVDNSIIREKSRICCSIAVAEQTVVDPGETFSSK